MKTKKTQPAKEFDFEISLKYAHNIAASGKTSAEAKRKAFKKFKASLKISDVDFD